MTRRPVLLGWGAIAALAGLAGCQRPPSDSVEAARTQAATAPAPAGIAAALARHAWVRTDPGAPLGDMRIFLAEGTLVMDSCFETYRLVAWRMESDSALAWSEDGGEIRARVLAVDGEALELRLELVAGSQDQHYRVATVPFTCPDMPR